MNNDQTKLICLGFITGCGVIATAVATRDAQNACVLVSLAFLIWFAIKFISMKP
jgi:hypothetical protein